MVRCLKQQLPGAEVHYLTKPAYRPLLEHNPYIDSVHVLDRPLLKKAAELKSLGFDYIIDLHHNLRTRILKSLLDRPSFSFDKLNTEKSLLVKLRIDTLPRVHIVDRYLETVSSFGVRNDGEGLDHFLPPQLAQDFRPEPLAAVSHYLAFAIGAQHFTKRLPREKIIGICRQLRQTVVLLGGPEDAQAGHDIAAQSGEHVINLCGRLSLHESACVVSRATRVITHDTGLMHIAAAFRKEIVSVWGNTVPAFGMTPYYGEHPVRQELFGVNGLSCRPCSRIGYKACPKGHFACMNRQDTGLISAAINQD